MVGIINTAPVVTGNTITVASGVSVAPSTLVTVTDVDGDTPTSYQIIDYDGEANSGYFTVGGVRQTALTTITVSAANWGSVRWFAGNQSGGVRETGWVRAFDGYEWSDWGAFYVGTTGSVNQKPVVTGKTTSVAAGTSVAVRNSSGSVFTAVDSDGDAIAKYQFWDGTTDAASGYFVLGGTVQSAGAVIDVSAITLSTLTWYAGTKSGNDTVFARAYDGKEWGAWTEWTMTTTGVVDTAPVVIGKEKTLPAGVALSIQAMFEVGDDDGDTITAYQFWDSDTASSSGYLRVAGVKQSAAKTIDVSAAQLSSTYWVGGSQPLSDIGWVRAFDGVKWSAWTTFTARTDGATNNKPTISASGTSVPLGLSQSASSLFAVSDTDGDTITAYEFWDSGGDIGSGYLTVNGEERRANSVVSVSSSQLSSTFWVAGTSTGTESLWVRAFDGREWSDWKDWTMTSTRSTGMAASAAPALTTDRRDDPFAIAIG